MDELSLYAAAMDELAIALAHQDPTAPSTWQRVARLLRMGPRITGPILPGTTSTSSSSSSLSSSNSTRARAKSLLAGSAGSPPTHIRQASKSIVGTSPLGTTRELLVSSGQSKIDLASVETSQFEAASSATVHVDAVLRNNTSPLFSEGLDLAPTHSLAQVVHHQYQLQLRQRGAHVRLSPAPLRDSTVRGNFPIDTRAEDVVLAVGTYFVASQGHFADRIVPYLVRTLMSLPFFRWRPLYHDRQTKRTLSTPNSAAAAAMDAFSHSMDASSTASYTDVMSHLNLPSANPAESFAMSLTDMFVEIGTYLPFLRDTLGEALLSVLGLCIDLIVSSQPVLGSPVLPNASRAERHLVKHLRGTAMQSISCLRGLLRSLGNVPFPFSATGTRRLAHLMDRALDSVVPLLPTGRVSSHALTLRVIGRLLYEQPALYSAERIHTLFARHATPIVKKYKQFAQVDYGVPKRKKARSGPGLVKLQEQIALKRMDALQLLLQSVRILLQCAAAAKTLEQVSDNLEQDAFRVLDWLLDSCLENPVAAAPANLELAAGDEFYVPLAVCHVTTQSLTELCVLSLPRLAQAAERVGKLLRFSRRLRNHQRKGSMQTILLNGLCTMYKSELVRVREVADSSIRAYVLSLVTKVVQANMTRESGAVTNAEEVQYTVLPLLGSILVMVNNREVTRPALQALVQVFSEWPDYLFIIVPYLAQLAVCSHDHSHFHSIVTLLLDAYRKLFVGSGKRGTFDAPNRREIPSAFAFIASALCAKPVATAADANGALVAHAGEPIGSADEVPFAAPRRAFLLSRLLKLFTQLGERTSTNVPVSPQPQSLGLLLPALATLISFRDAALTDADADSDHSIMLGLGATPVRLRNPTRAAHSTMKLPESSSVASVNGNQHAVMPASDESDAEDEHSAANRRLDYSVKQFRRFWFLMSLHRFASRAATDRARLAQDVLEAVQRIAARTPVLVLRSKHKYFSSELEAAVSRLRLPSKTLQDVKRELRSVAANSPDVAPSAIDSLKASHAVFLWTVMQLEMQRVSATVSSDFFAVFDYLGSAGIASAGLMPIVVAISNVVFRQYLDRFSSRPNAPQRNRDLQKHLTFLLVQCCSRFETVRTRARVYIDEMTTRFPQLQWSSACLSVALDLVQVVHNTVVTDDSLAGSLSAVGVPMAVGSQHGESRFSNRRAPSRKHSASKRRRKSKKSATFKHVSEHHATALFPPADGADEESSSDSSSGWFSSSSSSDSSSSDPSPSESESESDSQLGGKKEHKSLRKRWLSKIKAKTRELRHRAERRLRGDKKRKKRRKPPSSKRRAKGPRDGSASNPLSSRELGHRVRGWAGYALDLPGERGLRLDILKMLSDLSTAWLRNAQYLVPREAVAVVQEYVLSVQKRALAATHHGVALALSVGTANPASGPTNDASLLQYAENSPSRQLARLVSALSTKEVFLGEIRGRYVAFTRERQRRRFARRQQRRGLLRQMSEESDVSFNNEGRLPHRDDASKRSVPFGKLISMELQAELEELADRFRVQRARHVLSRDVQEVCEIVSQAEALIYRVGALLVWSIEAHTAWVTLSEADAGSRSQAARRAKHKLTRGAALENTDSDHPLLGVSFVPEHAQPRDFAIDTQSLLHLTCKIPTKLMCEETMRTAVFVWEWLLAADGSFEIPLLVEMKAAWSYTIDRHLGLFSAHFARTYLSHLNQADVEHLQHAAEDAANEEEANAIREQHQALRSLSINQPESHRVHELWTEFLADRFAVMRSRTQDSVNILAMMLHKAFARPDCWSTDRASYRARFKLLLLGLDIIQSVSDSLDLRDKELLRSRIYSVAFQWFIGRAQWPKERSLEEMETDVAVTIAVCKSFQADYDCYVRTLPRPIIASGSATAPALERIPTGVRSVIGAVSGRPLSRRSISRSGSRRLTRHLSFTRGRTRSSGALNHEADAVSEHEEDAGEHRDEMGGSAESLLLSQSPTEDSLSVIFNSSVPHNIKKERLRAMRDLLLFMLSHELDRMVCWHNPTGDPSKRFKNEHLFSANPSSLKNAQWVKYAETAWFVDARLAFALASRFPMISAIKRKLRELVTADPPSVYHVPEAVMYLIDKDKIVQAERAARRRGRRRRATGLSEAPDTMPELRHLMYWAASSLHTALTLLAPPYVTNLAVNEYAVHSLRSHPVKDVMFYLPQLVQSLRFDSHGVLRDYMIWAASSSVLLSHQLIWICEAELGKETPEEVEAAKLAATQADDASGSAVPGEHEGLNAAVVETLVADIKAAMGPAERAYFDAEFNLFEEITSISGVLKPLPTKTLRKAKIQECLEKIKHRDQLYLPTNPTSELVSVITDSGRPMQSAAKVPILVAFKCRRVGLEKEVPQDIREEVERQEKERQLAPHVVDKKPRGVSELDLPSLDGEDEHEAGAVHVSKLRANAEEEDEVDDDELKQDDEEDGNESDASSVSSVHQDDHAALNMQSPDNAGPTQDLASVAIEAVAQKRAEEQAAAEGAAVSPSGRVFTQACIFKVGDDCRQDALALQIIQLCKDIFERNGLELYLYPYRVLPNRIDDLIGGVIECVPNSRTRDEIGKATACSLRDHFKMSFGREDGRPFQQAQRNFILSLAGYAITSYILQAKDRHNGNIMFDNEGHLVHIDFGFVFDISPGRDMRFEAAGFKLTWEMVELMGADQNSELYKWFELLVIRGFLAVREHLDELMALVTVMTHSTLRCFKPDSLTNLRARFFPDQDERQAVEGIRGMMKEAFNNYRTNIYDYIQEMQQNIFRWKGGEEGGAE